ncbi:MAG: hypothetical protein KA271_04095 [Propionivibrio sp.]|jgi:hypothetical protein|nr:hypothetical protein [Propionivibrio sp.]
MAESFTQVPPNSTGNKMRTRSRAIGADTVHEQGVFTAALPTYYAVADAVAFANTKTHFSIVNESGSGVLISIRKLFPINVSIGALTGAALRMEARKLTAHSGGTAITAQSCDSTNPALPAQVTIKTNGTPTGTTLLYPFIITTEEETATAALTKNVFQAMTNLQPEGPEQQEYRLREGEGFSIYQSTNATVGSFAWFMVFTVETL